MMDACCTIPDCNTGPAPYERDGHDGLVCAKHGQVLAVIEPGRMYLGYMASPWTCFGYDPETDEALVRFGQPDDDRFADAEPDVWPRDKWRMLVLSDHQPEMPADGG